eukprot:6492760-Amphidinium_carterae.3
MDQYPVADYQGENGGVRLSIPKEHEIIKYEDTSIKNTAAEGSDRAKNVTVQEVGLRANLVDKP